VEDQLSYVIEVGAQSVEFDQVLALWRANRKTLGFLPDEGFLERAEKGTLLAARAGGELIGYVLFDLPDNKVKLVHLCVSRDRRGTGTARMLVDEVTRRYEQRRGIELACRRDFEEANRVWQRLGFLPLHERAGRSRARLPLTLWVLDHGHPDLFSEVRPVQELAVLDHTIVVDKAKKFAGEGKHSRPLFEDAWIAELIELAITGEVFVEVNRQDDPRVREATRAEAQSLRHIRLPRAAWLPLLDAVRQAVPKAGESDHKHIAQAAAAGAPYFVTRDDGILRDANKVRREFQLQVLRPEALIKQLDRRRFSDRYEPRAIEGTQVTSCDAAEISEARLVRAFLNFGRGERKAAFLETLRSLQADPSRHEASVLVDEDGNLLGLLGRHAEDGRLEVPLLRAARADRLEDALARQLAYLQRQVAADRRLGEVFVRDRFATPSITLALSAEGFRPTGSGWVCRVHRGIRDQAEVEGLDAKDPALAVKAAAVEHELWPGKTIGAGIPTYLVPIKIGWAERLFDTGLAEQTLLPRSSSLGLSREHVYYRSPRNHRNLGAGARILWYVSGAGPAQGEAHIRAVSHVVEVVIDRPRTLHRRFERLGVYSKADVEKAASPGGEVMAIRFVDTELLERPISKTDLEHVWLGVGERFSPPLSPVAIPEHMFCLVYRRTSRYAAD
jgi:ribosomal protein S18 acetylase RimI-like enzyme